MVHGSNSVNWDQVLEETTHNVKDFITCPMFPQAYLDNLCHDSKGAGLYRWLKNVETNPFDDFNKMNIVVKEMSSLNDFLIDEDLIIQLKTLFPTRCVAEELDEDELSFFFINGYYTKFNKDTPLDVNLPKGGTKFSKWKM